MVVQLQKPFPIEEKPEVLEKVLQALGLNKEDTDMMTVVPEN